MDHATLNILIVAIQTIATLESDTYFKTRMQFLAGISTTPGRIVIQRKEH